MIDNLDIDYNIFFAQKLTAEYAEKVYQLQNIVLKNLAKESHLVEVSKSRIEECLSDDKNECIGIFDKQDNKLIAYGDILLSKYSSENYYKSALLANLNKDKVLYFRAVFVDPNYRGNGFMQRILEYFFEFAKENKKEFIICTVDPTNSASMHSLKKLNFEVVDKYSFEHLGKQYHRNIMFKKL
ncbi:MAG: GNAT family N-acetyltransferase [Spirochaetales bacterium]